MGAAVQFPWLILSGHAKLPQDSVARSVWEILSIVVAVDPSTGVVVDVDATLVTTPAKAFVRELLMGRSLAQPSDQVLETIQTYYSAGAKRALIAAVKQVYEAWTLWKTGGTDAESAAAHHKEA